MTPRRVGLLWIGLIVLGFLVVVVVLGGWRSLAELGIAVGFIVGCLLVLGFCMCLGHMVEHDRWPWQDKGDE